MNSFISICSILRMRMMVTSWHPCQLQHLQTRVLHCDHVMSSPKINSNLQIRNFHLVHFHSIFSIIIEALKDPLEDLHHQKSASKDPPKDLHHQRSASKDPLKDLQHQRGHGAGRFPELSGMIPARKMSWRNISWMNLTKVWIHHCGRK